MNRIELFPASTRKVPALPARPGRKLPAGCTCRRWRGSSGLSNLSRRRRRSMAICAARDSLARRRVCQINKCRAGRGRGPRRTRRPWRAFGSNIMCHCVSYYVCAEAVLSAPPRQTCQKWAFYMLFGSGDRGPEVAQTRRRAAAPRGAGNSNTPTRMARTRSANTDWGRRPRRAQRVVSVYCAHFVDWSALLTNCQNTAARLSLNQRAFVRSNERRSLARAHIGAPRRPLGQNKTAHQIFHANQSDARAAGSPNPAAAAPPTG